MNGQKIQIIQSETIRRELFLASMYTYKRDSMMYLGTRAGKQIDLPFLILFEVIDWCCTHQEKQPGQSFLLYHRE